MSQCNQVAEKNYEYWKELNERALEQLRTKTFGGYKWDDISRKFRKKLIKNKVKHFINRERKKQTPVEVKKVTQQLVMRNQEWKQQRRERARQAIASSKLRVAVDCEWGETHSPKQNILLVKQLVEMDRYNRLAPQPSKLFLTGLREGDRIDQEGYSRAKKGLSSFLFSDITPLSPVEYFGKEEIVYLSPDAPQTLTSIDLTKVYIIGGLVDLGGGVGQTLNKAEKLGVTTMKLPVSEYMKLNTINSQRCILCLNQVLAILLDLYSGKEWTSTLVRHVPRRKVSMEIAS